MRNKIAIGTVHSDLGKIFVGDIYFALNLNNHKFKPVETHEYGRCFEVDGFKIAETAILCNETHIGSDGNTYIIKSGLFGLLPQELWDEGMNENLLDKIGCVLEENDLSLSYQQKGAIEICLPNGTCLVKIENNICNYKIEEAPVSIKIEKSNDKIFGYYGEDEDQ